MWSNISSPRAADGAELADVERHEAGPTSAGQGGSGSPLMRYKHAACSSPSGYIYIHGGRFGNLPLDDDVWRFDPHQNSWLQLDTRGDKPPSLQEHTLVEHNEQLYLFGGQVSASGSDNTFWRLDLVSNEWHSLSLTSSRLGAHLGPSNRRGHSAVVYGHSMYVFGGYEDFRGSSGQLWEYKLASQRWELCNLSSTSACQPESRHSHSAVVHHHSMYVYGGLSNLKPLGDLWRWSWRERRWFRERTSGSSPGQLHGHSAIQAFDSMFVFGGERNGRPTRGLWRLNLTNMSWQKVRAKGPKPSPTTWHGAIANPLSILDETNYIVEGDPEFLAERPAPSDRSCYSRAELAGRGAKQEPLSHSKSSNALDSSAPKALLLAQNHQNRLSKRRSRLGFLKRNHRLTKSTYELKQLQASLSSGDFTSKQPTINRLSIPSKVEHCGSKCERAKAESGQTNAKILDSLDMDIKQMFQRALSPVDGQTNGKRPPDDDGRGEPMLVEADSLARDQSQLLTSGHSHYQTAVAASCDTITNPKSQRTSYAYSTPPSELNTLRGGSSASKPALWPAGSNAPAATGERSRPKSETVQSLIERADADIMRLYTPHFHPTSSAGQRASLRAYRLDKSKRHTIHQTSTYYNLYFSEDKSSTSSPSDSSGGANNQPAGTSGQAQSKEAKSRCAPTRHFGMVRDELSSSTLRASDRTATTSGVLVGVHGASQASDRRSELSLEGSDSRTLCGDVAGQTSGSDPADTSASNLAAALTARHDTMESSCDNTSLSFSVIAEFEEDDMLQYSSPTEPNIGYRNADRFEASKEDEPMGGSNEDMKKEVQSTDNVNNLAQKSASSGYDSMSGSDQINRRNSQTRSELESVNSRPTNGHPPSHPTNASDTQEDSSLRTDSSLGGYTEMTEPHTSPEKWNPTRNQHQTKSDFNQNRAPNGTISSTTADSLALTTSEPFPESCSSSHNPSKSLPSSPAEQKHRLEQSSTQRKMPLMSRSRHFFSKNKSKNRYWQLCMFVIGGKQNCGHQVNEPITIWRLYI